MSWQDAVARLAAERTRAETCVQLLKRHADEDAAAVSRGQLLYAEAKADTDAVIGGLIVVLAQGDEPPSLPDLEAKLTRGVKDREAFCNEVLALVPKDEGTKNLVVDLVGAFVGPLIEAAVELYKFENEEDRLLRKTIQTQLEATKWPDFQDIAA